MIEKKLEKNIKLMKWISLYFSLLLFLAIVIRLLVSELEPVLLILGSSICISLFVFHFFADKNIAYNVLASIFIFIILFGLFVGAFFAGGINSPVIIIFPISAVFAFILFEKDIAWIVIGILTLFIIMYAGLQVSGFAFPQNELSKDQASIMRAVWLIFNILIMALSISFFKTENEELRQKLFEDSITDHLTGLPNRRFIEEFMKFELALAKREARKVSILVIDIDFFKKYNDNYGHIAGDECLVKVAKALETHFKRSTDLIGRYGGEEFVVMLSGLNDSEIFQLAESFHANLASLSIPHEYSEFGRITVSIGIDTYNDKIHIEMNDLIASADKALYASKANGRNCTTIADSVI